MLSLEQAQAAVTQNTPVLGGENVAIEHAHLRFLAEELAAARDLPPWDNSAVDGFAARSEDLPGTLRLTGTVTAGSVDRITVLPGTTVRIMTGAPVPAGATTVIMREDSSLSGENVSLPAGRHGANIRRQGEDSKSGSPLLAQGACLRAGELAALAAHGHATLRCGRRPRVALLSTGNELIDVRSVPQGAQIVDSNRHSLAAQIANAHADLVTVSHIADALADTEAALASALANHDVVITCGGVSVGDADYVKTACANVGVGEVFWKVAMQPGKPVYFGTTTAGALLFGLPGNPVSALVAFELFVRPALIRMQGGVDDTRAIVPVRLATSLHKSVGRTLLVRCRIHRDGEQLIATPLAQQGSGMHTSFLGVDGLVIVHHELASIERGAVSPALLWVAR